jgi:RHS repeat-associated protein
MGRLVQFSYTENSVTKTEILTWAGWTLMSREIFTGNTVSETFRYTWGTDLSGTMEGAGGVGGLLAVERNISGSNTWDIRYTHADANGNIIALTNSSGVVSARYRYDAFGKTIDATDVDNSGWVNHNIHGFSSKASFGNQGLLYYGYRWYSPSLGRWINRDPIEENGGVNLYGFVGNDGVNALDLLGLNGITTGFPTADAAGTAGTLAAVLLTQSRKPFGAEWCGQVCKKGCDFAYSQPVMGTDPKDLKGTIYNGLCNPSKSKCPDGWSSVGFYHSHPYGPDFNKTDLDAAAGYQNMYVGGAGTDKDEPGDIEILKFTRDDAMKIYKSLKPGQDIVVVYPLLEELIDEHTKSLGKFPPQLHPIK